jgi:D-aspartate ligase
MNPLALVLGRIDLIRALGLGGIDSVVVARRDDPVRYSRHVRDTIEADDGARLDALLDYASSADEPLPLFYDSDAALLFISRERERLGERYRFVIPPANLVDHLLDKAKFQELAERLDLPVPRGHRIDLNRNSGRVGLEFPIVLKAVPYRDDRWDRVGFSSKVVRVDNEDELDGLWRRLAAADLDIVAQELVPGSEAHLESYHVYVDESGEIAAEFTGRKIRTWPRDFGLTTSLTTTADPEVAALGREVIGRLGFRGVAKLDLKRGPDGRLHLLEVNPRFTLWAHVGAVAGVNIPAVVYADLMGRARPESSRAEPCVTWVWPRPDAAAARAEGVPRSRWLLWALRSKTNAAWAWHDPAPYLRGRLGRRLMRRGRSAPREAAPHG